jgi:hypothetical protein
MPHETAELHANNETMHGESTDWKKYYNSESNKSWLDEQDKYI